MKTLQACFWVLVFIIILLMVALVPAPLVYVALMQISGGSGQILSVICAVLAFWFVSVRGCVWLVISLMDSIEKNLARQRLVKEKGEVMGNALANLRGL